MQMETTASGPLWQPSKERIANATLTAFMRQVEGQWDVRLSDYVSL